MPTRATFWRTAKILLAVLLLAFVARNFSQILGQVDWAALPAPKPLFVLAAGLLYLLCHTIWGTYWVQLLRAQGVVVPWWIGQRAYFISQLGKYVPGKALVVLLRVSLMRGQNAKPTVVIVTGVYETLTSMAAGAILGAVLLPASGLIDALSVNQRYGLFGLALLPLGLLGLNRLARRIVRKYAPAMNLPLPSLWFLLRGLALDSLGWCCLALSLWCVHSAWSETAVLLTADRFTQSLGGVCVAYVIGFVVLVAPGGIGAREWALALVLATQLGDAGFAAVLALMLRVIWTSAELTYALVLALAIRPHAAPAGAA